MRHCPSVAFQPLMAHILGDQWPRGFLADQPTTVCRTIRDQTV